MNYASFAVSIVALLISAASFYVTLIRAGKVRMIAPTLIFLGPDGKAGSAKIFLSTLLYSTARRGNLIQNLYAKLVRDGGTQTFNEWTCGRKGELGIGCGLKVGEDGIALDHHFLRTADGEDYEFKAGSYRLDVYAVTIDEQKPTLLLSVPLGISLEHAAAMNRGDTGLFYSWQPDTQTYFPHIRNEPQRRSATTTA